MFSDDILDRCYQEQLLQAGNIPGALKEYLRLYGDSFEGSIRILEVGAGTGSITKYPLEALCPLGTDDISNDSKLAEYIFTDISASFLEKGKEKFKDWQDVMTFKTLDLEAEIDSQNFEPEAYDMVIAYNVSS